MVTITLTGPDKVTSIVESCDGTTVRDIATYKYDLFGRTTKLNGLAVDPFTTTVADGDTVGVESR